MKEITSIWRSQENEQYQWIVGSGDQSPYIVNSFRKDDGILCQYSWNGSLVGFDIDVSMGSTVLHAEISGCQKPVMAVDKPDMDRINEAAYSLINQLEEK